MTVLRRLDAVLEPTKEKVLEEKKWLDEAGISEQAGVLEQAAGQAFYNTSPFQLRDLTSRATQQQLRDDFNAYLDGFSPNVQDILEKFEFRNQINRLSDGDVLGSIVNRFLSTQINLSPEPVLNADGSVRHPGLDNHAMGTIFEDLVRRFNEDNNEEAGEHWTPRDAVELMAQLVFQPVRDRIESGTYLLYDGAIGTGGMLTIAEQTLQGIAADKDKQVSTHLYGQEINNETYAICEADMLLKGEQNIAEHHRRAPALYPVQRRLPVPDLRLMLSNPPYGKSWSDLEHGRQLKDPRFLSPRPTPSTPSGPRPPTSASAEHLPPTTAPSAPAACSPSRSRQRTRASKASLRTRTSRSRHPPPTGRRSTTRPTRSARPTCSSRGSRTSRDFLDAENIIGGPQHSTLSNDAFRSQTFDFMLSNPPYGKSWKGDLDRMGGNGCRGLKDPRFLISHAGNPEYSLVTRTSDGQMLFLANMASKMNQESKMGQPGVPPRQPGGRGP